MTAYNGLKEVPDSLLLLLSECTHAQEGQAPPVSEETFEKYVQQAVKKRLTFEAAMKMRDIYKRKKDRQQEKCWEALCRQLDRDHIHAEKIIPDVFFLSNSEAQNLQ